MYNHTDKTDHKLWITLLVDNLVTYQQVSRDKHM